MNRRLRVLLMTLLVVTTFLMIIEGVAADSSYIVKAGDTLFAIGRRFGVNPYAIASYNHLANPNLIYVGQRLIIPGCGFPQPSGHPVPAPAPSQPTAPAPVIPSSPAAWPTALCWDGSYSYSLDIRATCFAHGGVQVWMNGAGWYYVPKYFEAPAPAVPPPVASCECSSNLFDCEDFASPWVAQACFEHCRAVVGRDVHWLDRDGDGLACELTTSPAN
jgi:LysM repeat protein